jgi:hypothetical protein
VKTATSRVGPLCTNPSAEASLPEVWTKFVARPPTATPRSSPTVRLPYHESRVGSAQAKSGGGADANCVGEPTSVALFWSICPPMSVLEPKHPATVCFDTPSVTAITASPNFPHRQLNSQCGLRNSHVQTLRSVLRTPDCPKLVGSPTRSDRAPSDSQPQRLFHGEDTKFPRALALSPESSRNSSRDV